MEKPCIQDHILSSFFFLSPRIILRTPPSKWGMDIFQNYNLSQDYLDPFPWSKWVLLRVDGMGICSIKVPLKLHPPPNLQEIPNSELTVLKTMHVCATAEYLNAFHISLWPFSFIIFGLFATKMLEYLLCDWGPFCWTFINMYQ